MEQIAYKKGVPLMDIILAFETLGKENEKQSYVNPAHDLIHPSALGHKIISTEIYNTLGQYSLLLFVLENRWFYKYNMGNNYIKIN